MQKKQELLEHWAAMWSHINDQAEGELKDASEGAEDDEGQVSTSSTAELDDIAEFERVAVGGLLRSIADELKKVEKDMRGVLEVIQNVPQDKLVLTLDAQLVAMSGIASCTTRNIIPGEWINIALGKFLLPLRRASCIC